MENTTVKHSSAGVLQNIAINLSSSFPPLIAKAKNTFLIFPKLVIKEGTNKLPLKASFVMLCLNAVTLIKTFHYSL